MGIREALGLDFKVETCRQALQADKAHNTCKYPVAKKKPGALRTEVGLDTLGRNHASSFP